MNESKSLREIKITHAYSSDTSSLLKDFYIPVLSTAKEYNRITGYFSATSLAVAAKGISELIENDGKVNLITGFFVNKTDLEAAQKAQDNPEFVVWEMGKIIEGFKNLEDVFTKECIKAFAWMLAKNMIEIKVAVPMSKKEDQYEGIFHQKIGLVKDGHGNSISFSGSINETGYGWLANIENFKVFKEWEKNEKAYFDTDKNNFLKLWNNLSDKVRVVPLDDALKEKLIMLAPLRKEEINFDILRGKSLVIKNDNVQKNRPTLRNYQEKAISQWKDNKFQGILEMATGTGKTLIGLNALEIYYQREEEGICIIGAPTKEICNQWTKKAKQIVGDNLVISIGSDNINWRNVAENYLHDFERDRKQRAVFISTYDSLPNLTKLLIKYNTKPVFLIADEVHALGAEKRSKILLNDSFNKIVSYRLGLSATPERLYDKEGNDVINYFFGKVIFKYTLGDAIKDKILCPYYYYVKFAEMTYSEYSEYVRLSKKMAKTYYISQQNTENEYYNILINQRAKIIKSSEDKLEKIRDIFISLKEKDDLCYTLVFCIDNNQLDDLAAILDKYGIIHSKITGEENKEERERILTEFANGRIEVLLSIKILDEGIDIPKIKNAIILSSSRNPREYVQRRGRVLRKLEGENKIAKIYDFFVIPKIGESSDEQLFELERSIIKKELSRMFEFIRYSKNAKDIFTDEKITKIIKNYKLAEMYSTLT